MFDVPPIVLAIVGGILPAFFWLWFWRREDRAHPEPRWMITLAFIAGMIAVPFVIPFQRSIVTAFGDSMLTIVLWAAVEEVFKYLAALVAVLYSRFMDEPVDGLIYMITVALGFSALENVFFLLGPFSGGDVLGGLLTGNLRFMGATLLHTVSSALVGAAIGFSFYRHRLVKYRYVFIGLILASILHALFNLFIMNSKGNELFYIFGGVWLGVLGVIMLFERVKRVRTQQQ